MGTSGPLPPTEETETHTGVPGSRLLGCRMTQLKSYLIKIDQSPFRVGGQFSSLKLRSNNGTDSVS